MTLLDGLVCSCVSMRAERGPVRRMSPEHIMGGKVSPKADVFSYGGVHAKCFAQPVCMGRPARSAETAVPVAGACTTVRRSVTAQCEIAQRSTQLCAQCCCGRSAPRIDQSAVAAKTCSAP